jgi:hypothetical protein
VVERGLARERERERDKVIERLAWGGGGGGGRHESENAARLKLTVADPLFHFIACNSDEERREGAGVGGAERGLGRKKYLPDIFSAPIAGRAADDVPRGRTAEFPASKRDMRVETGGPRLTGAHPRGPPARPENEKQRWSNRSRSLFLIESASSGLEARRPSPLSPSVFLCIAKEMSDSTSLSAIPF